MKQRPRIYYSDTQKALMWERWKQGWTLHEIGKLFDRAHSSIHRIIAETGGFRPPERSRAAIALTLAEREDISRAMVSGESIRSIATRLGRAPSTICREIKRNRGCDGYRATQADEAAWGRARRPKRCKLRENRALARIVAHKLRLLWSPEQIAGWLKRTYPCDENPWIFGEEYHLSVDDMSLTEVLRKHKALLGGDVVIDAPVKHVSQTRGIVDLVLSRQIRRHRTNDLTHLVVELKVPAVKVDKDEISQIEGYAATISADERFRNVDVKWMFWVISDDIGPVGKFRIGENSTTGLIHKSPNVSIYIKTWAQVLDDNRARMQFFQERLEFKVDKGEALKHLQERYATYLEGVLDTDDDPSAAMDTVRADPETETIVSRA